MVSDGKARMGNERNRRVLMVLMVRTGWRGKGNVWTGPVRTGVERRKNNG